MISTSTTTEYRHNILADGQVVTVHTIDQSGSAYTDYLHYDHLGSVDAITGDQGNVIQAMSFDAFGQRRDATNWDYDLSQNTIATLKNYTDRGYTDQEQLDNLSLVDMNGRVYDPTVGRMISADPTIPDPLYSQAFNRYNYVYNSPLEYTDPSGFTSCPPTQRHCPTSSDGSGDSGTNTETGSRIPGVNTGASCSGDCTGAGTGNWGPMGPGSGSGNGAGNGGGDPPDESGGGDPGTSSGGSSSSNSGQSAGNDNQSLNGASAMQGSCGNCANLGPISVTGIAIGNQGGLSFASWNTLFSNSAISVNQNSWIYAGSLHTDGSEKEKVALLSNQYLLIVPESNTPGFDQIYFYATPIPLDQYGNPMSLAFDPSTTQISFYEVASTLSLAGKLGIGSSLSLDAGVNSYGTGYLWIIFVPPQGDTNGNSLGMTLLFYVQSPGRH